MEYYGIGFANIRMSNVKNDYTHKYNYRVNTFPEEVFLHEFLHTLERNLMEHGYEIPELHDSAIYGYKDENLVGLKKWYQDYMNCEIYDKETNSYVGLDKITYTLKPPHESDFKYSVEIDFNKEPQNIIGDIKSLIDVVVNAI
ncbi:MAG: hypothetical protein E7314_04765 [Clostridiales bacterium]|nr:hypothetical protein [Clostridiales bacterium]